ncbi:MAG: glycosyltransferase family 4 protein [Rhodospirillaceae bacterium]|nr:glycosyltransferase family 4 protein [Rhodospirillaceae bacterium]
MTTAINFDGHTEDDNRPLGIDVATREFVRAFFRHASQDTFPVVCPHDGALGQFKQYASEERVDPARCVGVNQNDADTLAEAGHLFRYDPGFLKHIWTRRQFGQNLYSISGLVHASSTDSVMDTVGQYLTAPTQSWDALVCPSNSIKAAVMTVIEHWQEYLKERTGADFRCPMQFPVIPLGTDTRQFAEITSDQQRLNQRQSLDIEEDEIVILFAGRLNFIAKANPLPLMLGVERAAIEAKTPVRLVFCGYFNDELSELGFKEAAAAVCNLARVSFIRHGDAEYPDGFWAGADIFCSLADNIQESFGLTPIEAMASELPVVASDWDGYRDTVRDGVDGYLIPTLAPRKGLGDDLAYTYFSRQATYGDYLGATQQSTAVDIDALTDALKRLIENPNLRRTLGAAGKERANDKFAWPKIILAYEEFWRELADRRSRDNKIAAKRVGKPFHPSRPDPFDMFESFPSAHFSETGEIELIISNWSEAMKLIALKTGFVYADSLIEIEEMPFLIGHLEPGRPVPIKVLIGLLPQLESNDLIRTLNWLTKLGICRYHP